MEWGHGMGGNGGGWKPYGNPMGTQWGSNGTQPQEEGDRGQDALLPQGVMGGMETLWEPNGNPMESEWKPNGNPMGINGNPMGTQWKVNGNPMGINGKRKVTGDKMHFFLKE